MHLDVMNQTVREALQYAKNINVGGKNASLNFGLTES